jgi:hypothetical protein
MLAALLGVAGGGEENWNKWARVPPRPRPRPRPNGGIGVMVVGVGDSGGDGAGGATFCFFVGVGDGGVGGEWCIEGGLGCDRGGVEVVVCDCVVLLHTSFCGGLGLDSSSMLSSRAAKVLEVELGGLEGWAGSSLSFFFFFSSNFFLYIREGLL